MVKMDYAMKNYPGKNFSESFDKKVKNLPEHIFLSGHFLKEISIFDNIYIEISGGYHSTITVILFYELGYKNIGLIHNNTKLQYSECLDNIQKLIYLTDYSLLFKNPNLKKKSMNLIMKESFQNIEKAKLHLKNYRDYFNCCKILKQTRNHKWNNDFLLDNSIIISSLIPYESYNRQMRLFELKKKDTYIRFHKKQNIFKGYPYRDLLIGNRIYSRKIYDKLFENKLKEYNLNIIHSGCKICPIRILFPIMLNNNDCSIKYNKIFNSKNKILLG